MRLCSNSSTYVCSCSKQGRTLTAVTAMARALPQRSPCSTRTGYSSSSSGCAVARPYDFRQQTWLKNNCAPAAYSYDDHQQEHPAADDGQVSCNTNTISGSSSSSTNSKAVPAKPYRQARSRFARQNKGRSKPLKSKSTVLAENGEHSSSTTVDSSAKQVPWYAQEATPNTRAATAAQNSSSNHSNSREHCTDDAVSVSLIAAAVQHQELVQQQNAADVSEPQSSSGSSRGAALSSQLLSDQQIGQLQQYLDHMLEVNKSMNLTAIRDPAEAWERHIEDSLALLPVIDSYVHSSSSSSSNNVAAVPTRSRKNLVKSTKQGVDGDNVEPEQQQQQQLRVIDVGTGAGLPGMVLAVARPQWKVTLLDSLRKRCNFLQETADMLGLDNVTVVWARAEEGAARKELREAHDLAVARAVAELRVLSELCLPFVKPGGHWIAAKGANPQDEVAAAQNALSKLGGKLVAVELVESWAPEGQRTAVVVRKVSSTPAKYPRPPGTPNKKPL